MNIYIVVPNWNGEEYLQKCIDSLLSQITSCSVVIVDNGSVDGSVDIVKAYGAQVKLIELPVNTGFANAVNVGIRYALENDAVYVALFNNDAIADSAWLSRLVESAEKNKSAGAFTCKFLQINSNRIDSTGDFYTIYGAPFCRGRGEIDSNQFDSNLDVFSCSGGASLYRVSLFNDIGFFDNDFFAYYEDIDFGFRAQILGWSSIYVPDAIAYHHIGGTSKKVSGFAIYHMAKNFWLVCIKNMPYGLLLKYFPFLMFWYFRTMVGRVLKGGLKFFVKGAVAGIVLLPKKIQERSLIQRRRVASTAMLDSLLTHSKPPKHTA